MSPQTTAIENELTITFVDVVTLTFLRLDKHNRLLLLEAQFLRTYSCLKRQ
jgi:hypothetical protein